MTFGVAEKAIEDWISSNWASANTGAVLFMQNSKESKLVPTPPFVEFAVVGEDEEIIAVGGGPGRNKYRVTGRADITVFVPVYSGLAKARLLRDTASGFIRGKSFLLDAGKQLQFYGISPIGGGSSADQGNSFSLMASGRFAYTFLG